MFFVGQAEDAPTTPCARDQLLEIRETSRLRPSPCAGLELSRQALDGPSDPGPLFPI